MENQSKRKKYSKTEKLAILKEASTQPVTATLAKQGIYPATYYSWKKKFEQMGEQGLDPGIYIC